MPTHAKLAVLTAMMPVLLLAGCTENTAENNAPTADLAVDRQQGWTTESFTFDGGASTDSDGSIARYRFDFGDGTNAETTPGQEPEVQHRYLHGGEFAATLTVTDNGNENEGALTDTDTVQVKVNERVSVSASVAQTAPVGVNATVSQSRPFTVYEDADRFELNLTVTSLLPAGSSEITVRVLDPSNQTLDEERSTVAAGQSHEVQLAGPLTKQNQHRVEITANSGAARSLGELRVYY